MRYLFLPITEDVADIYNVIQRYLHAFKTIEFAIYCLPKDDVNFKTFKKTFSK